jgi:hypothetical protein
VTGSQSSRISGWAITIGVAAAICIYWIIDVRRSPAIREALAVTDRYACIKADDPGLPYRRKSMRLSERTYASMGGENYIQALWWLPLTQLAISVQFSRDRISQMYAATAPVWGPRGTRIVGFDAMSRLIYGRAFCDLDRVRKIAIDHVVVPSDLPADGGARAEIEHARSILREYHDRIYAQRRRSW